jgi:hypothetical protein
MYVIFSLLITRCWRLLDRLIHRAHRIHLTAKESMREREAAKLVATAKAAAQS